MEPVRNTMTRYTFQSAKKIYFTKTPSKYLLMEKKIDYSKPRVLSLFSRNTFLYSRENGTLLFPKTN